MEKMTGLSRAQVTRLITLYLSGEEVKAQPYHRHSFVKRYTREDVELLADVDEAHGCLSGPATQKLLYRACHDFGQAEFVRLAALSVPQLYRLRHGAQYRKRSISYQPTRPTPVSIGERRRPEPNGRPGYLRVDTVHQGDLDGTRYRKRSISYQPTRPTPVSIGERRRPEPNGRPGYLRVDTVHQGDLDGTKGVYHIN